MSLTTTRAAPPGWYPDPSAAHQWREWTGSRWSDVTRTGDETAVATGDVAASLPLIGALQRLVRYGIAAIFSGLGLLVGSLAHWPGTAHPSATWFATTCSDAGVALLVFGSLAFAFAARALQVRWTFASLVPGINILLVASLVIGRLGARSPLRRVLTEAALLTLYIAQSHGHPWLDIVPMVVAVDHLSSVSALVEQLSGPGHSPMGRAS